MARQVINVGTEPNSGTGDPIRTAYIKCNDNFGELYSRSQSTPPTTLVGSPGDQAGMYAYDSTYFYYCYANYDGSSVIWAQVTQIGNASVSSIVNGTSNVRIADINGNVDVSVNGVDNIAVFTSTGVSLAGNVTTGNVNATKIYGLIETADQPNITSVGILNSLSVGGNVTGGNLIATTLVKGTTVSATGNVIGGNVNTAGLVSATGNVSAGNIRTGGTVSATGNIITDGYFVGTFYGNVTGNFVVPGGNTQVIFNTAGNADASASFTFNKDSNVMTVDGTVSATGNVQGGNVNTSGLISADGNISAGNLRTVGTVSATGNLVTGANTVVAGYVTAVGNISGGNIRTGGYVSAAGNVNGGNILATGQISATTTVTGSSVIGGVVSAVSNISGANINITTLANVVGNVTAGNVLVAGIVSAAGNVSGAYILGDISQATGYFTSKIANGTSEVNISTAGGNANVTINNTANVVVVAQTGAYVTGVVSASGAVTSAANITGGNILTGGSISATGNVTAGNVNTVTFAGTTVSVSGNVTAGNVLGGANVNATTHTGTTVSVTGTVTGGNLVTAGTLTVNSGGAATAIINGGSNAAGNIGSSTKYFNTVYALAMSALYADIAEKYTADAEYEPGTVVTFGGANEVTVSNVDGDPLVAGVISTNPSVIMNSGIEGEHIATVALVGRVPTKVTGPITRGAMLVSDGQGRARAEKNPAMGTVIGKALENFEGEQGVIEVVVGRL